MREDARPQQFSAKQIQHDCFGSTKLNFSNSQSLKEKQTTLGAGKMTRGFHHVTGKLEQWSSDSPRNPG